MTRRRPPEVVPVLSRGKHRSPRKGACFMEYASWLAGERWSDHPRCTHPLLATVARLINDYTSDSSRQRLVGLIPSVVGLDADDPAIDLIITVRCAEAAMAVASEPRQRALAVVLKASLDLLADFEGDPLYGEVSERARRGLSKAPLAARWAEEFSAEHDISLEAYRKRSAPAAARLAVVGIAEAAISDANDRLYELLVSVIDDCHNRLTDESPGAEDWFITARPDCPRAEHPFSPHASTATPPERRR